MAEAEIRKVLLSRNYELIEEIGSGGYACVYKVLSLKYKTEFFASKVIKIDPNLHHDQGNKIESFTNEIETLKTVSHPNIISIFDHFHVHNNFYIILEYCSNGNMNDFIKKNGPLKTRNDFFLVAHQLLKAIDHLHSNKIAHRDVKPANVFIDNYGRVKLGDFGLALTIFSLEKKGTADDENDQNESQSCGCCCKSFAGSQAFQAPEIVQKLPFDPMKADIWSIGITLYFFAVGELPWRMNSSKNVLKDIAKGRIILPSTLDRKIHNFLKATLIVDPKSRPTAQSLLHHYGFFEEQNVTTSAKNISISINPVSNKITSFHSNGSVSIANGGLLNLNIHSCGFNSGYSTSRQGHSIRAAPTTVTSSSKNMNLNTNGIINATTNANVKMNINVGRTGTADEGRALNCFKRVLIDRQLIMQRQPRKLVSPNVALPSLATCNL